MNFQKKQSILNWREQRTMGLLTIAEGLLIFFIGSRAPGLTLKYIMDKALENMEEKANG